MSGDAMMTADGERVSVFQVPVCDHGAVQEVHEPFCAPINVVFGNQEA